MRLRRDRLKLTTTLRDTLSAQRDALTGRPLRYRSQAIKNYAAICRMRRDRSLTSQTAFGGQLTYKGSLVRPVVRFHHSLSEYNGRLLRITSHGFSSDSDAAFRRDRLKLTTTLRETLSA